MTEPATSDDGWQRLHPLSPILRGGVVLLAVVGYVVSQLFDEILGSLDPTRGFPGGGPDEGPGTEVALRDHPLVALALLGVVVAGVAAVSWVSWRFARFRVGGGQVELRSGVVFRQHRQVRLERVQAVETTRPLLARLVGLSQVVVQSAGGSDSQLTLAFLGAARAEELRAHLLDLAGRADERVAGALVAPEPSLPTGTPDPGAEAGPTTPTPVVPPRGADEGHPLVTVPNGRLFVATILHPATLILGVLLVGAAFTVGITQAGIAVLGAAPAMVPVVFGLAVGRVKELLVHGNFSIARTATTLRVRHGLTDLRVSSVPLHRVQAVEVRQSLWWRPFGWWRVQVNVAGVHGTDEGEETTLLPVGTVEEAFRVLGTLGVPPGDAIVLGALRGEGPDGGWVGPPAAARRLDPWSWRRIGYVLSPTAIHLRAGRWTRRAVLVPHARVQSLTVSQGPLQARLGIASVTVVSTPGPVTATVPHLSTRDAEELLAVETERARAARRVLTSTGPAEPLAPRTPPLVDYPHSGPDEMRG